MAHTGYVTVVPVVAVRAIRGRTARGDVRRQGRAQRTLGGGPFGLVAAQFFLAYAAHAAAIIGVLHGLNALAIFAGRRLRVRLAATWPWARQTATAITCLQALTAG